MTDKEPAAIIEARKALKRHHWVGGAVVAFSCLGWLPMLFLESDAVGMIPFAVYMLGLLFGTGLAVWSAEKNKWATSLVKSWERSQADATLRASIEADAPVGAESTTTASLMARIRAHLEVDARALRAAEEAYARLQGLRTEEAAAQAVLQGLGPGEGRNKLEAALQKVTDERKEVEGTLAALYATLLTLESEPSFHGLQETMRELEAEVEVSRASTEALARARKASSTRQGQ